MTDKIHKTIDSVLISCSAGMEFPQPKDRSPNQPSIIIQPNVVQEMMRKIVSIARVVYTDGRDDVEKAEKEFERGIDCYEDTDIGQNDHEQGWNFWKKHALFVSIARLVGWSSVRITGKQIILTAEFK